MKDKQTNKDGKSPIKVELIGKQLGISISSIKAANVVCNKTYIEKNTPRKKIKVLWYSDFLRPTGFGNVAEEILTRLKATGKYEFTVLGINYNGVPYNTPDSEYYHLKDIKVWPAFSKPGDNLFGYNKLRELLVEEEYDIFFALQDSFNMIPLKGDLENIKKRKDFAYIFYFPIDGNIKRDWVEHGIKVADFPVTYTDYGIRKVNKLCSSIKLSKMYHGADLDKFKPFDTEVDRKKFRAKFFGKDAVDDFIIVNVNRNQRRKDLPRCVFAFQDFCEKNPKIPARLYLHCLGNDSAGYNLIDLIRENIPRHIADRIAMPSAHIFGEGGYPVEILSKIYASADIVTSTTTGEGWGLCLHPESMIKTSNGYKEISSIKQGEKVLTRKGYKEVVDKNSRSYEGDLVNITVNKRAISLSLKVTPEHQVLTKEGWKDAKDLIKTDILYVAKDSFEGYERHIFDLADYCIEKDYCKTETNIWVYGAKKKDYKRFMPLNKNFAELYGIYLAEGSASKGGIVFSISQEEDWLTERIRKLVKNVWGLEVAIENDKDSKKRWVRVYGNILEEFYRKIAGRGARNKRISILNMLTKHTAGKVLIGFWYGDGSTEPSGYEMTTCSKQLVHDLSQIGDKLGMRLSIEHNVKRDSYRLRTGKDYAYKLSMIAGNQKFEKYGFNNIEDTIEVSIKELKKTHYSGEVYDITVEEEPEFQTNQCIVHNCTTEAMACKTPVVMPNNSSTTEIIGAKEERGYLVDSGNTPSLNTVLFQDNDIVRPLTDIDSLTAKWKEVYDNREEALEKAEKAYEWLQKHTWDIVAKQWEELFDKAYKESCQ